MVDFVSDLDLNNLDNDLLRNGNNTFTGNNTFSGTNDFNAQVIITDNTSIFTGTGDFVVGIQQNVDDGIVATPGGGQGDSPMTGAINRVVQVNNNNDAVTLPPLLAGQTVVVINDDDVGTNQIAVFPASGEDIGAGVDTAVILPFATPIMSVYTLADGVAYSHVN